MKIVELDGYAANPGDISWDGLKELGELTIYPRTAPEEVVERAKEADAILINKVNITEAVLEQLPKLKYIGVLATGYNVVDVEAAHKRGVVVTNIPSYSTESVVQMTFAHIFNITNQVAHYGDASRQGRWSANPDFCYWDTPLMELSGKTLGIVGLGHIGQRVAAIAHQFGMDVFAVTSKDAMSLPKGIQKTTLDGLLGVADIISLHSPLKRTTTISLTPRRLAVCERVLSSLTRRVVRWSTSKPLPTRSSRAIWLAMEPTSWSRSHRARIVRSSPNPTPT